MARPKFSVVIPTRNRPKLTKIAVASVLKQTLQDFELVISDNSENEETREAISTFDDSRLHYERVEGLSMCDNWEAACDRAQGEYLCLLEDKQALKFHALARIQQVVEECNPEALRWQWDSLEDYGLGKRIRRNGGRGPVHSLSADEALDTLVHGSYQDAKHRLPIAHYSAIRRDVLQKIRNAPLGRLFPPVSPDYTLAIQALNYCEEVTYIEEGLVCFSDTTVSNGLSVRMKTGLAKEFAASLGGDIVFYDRVPVKARTVSGSIYNDYVMLREELGGRLTKHEPDWPNYFCACYDAIQSSVVLGVDMDEELAEWNRALAEQSQELRDETAARLKSSERRRNSLGRRIRKSAVVQSATRNAKSLLNSKLLQREDWRYSEIWSYLEHEASKQA
ncbi:MAG: hypothetical protein ACI8X5_000711 [Planctomycetota bacterium]|jgi:hypothetical protein